MNVEKPLQGIRQEINANLEKMKFSTGQIQNLHNMDKCLNAVTERPPSATQEKAFPRMVNAQERSVIQSCGNPPNGTLSQLGEIPNREMISFTDSAIRLQHESRQSHLGVYQSGGTPCRNSTGSPLSERCPCDDSTSFGSVESGHDSEDIGDIGYGLRDIISTLNQYHNTTFISDYDTGEDDISDVPEVYQSGCGNVNTMNGNPQDLVWKLENFLKQEPMDFQDGSLQYRREENFRYSCNANSTHDNHSKLAEYGGTGRCESLHIQSPTTAVSQAGMMMAPFPSNLQVGYYSIQ